MSNKSEARKIMKGLDGASQDVLAKLLAEVARARPKAIVNAYNELYSKHQPTQVGSPVVPAHLDDELRALIREGKKISAIKLCREKTGLYLIPAKDYVLKLIVEMEGPDGDLSS